MLLGPSKAGRPYRPDEDDAISRCLRGDGDLAALASRLGRSLDALRLHAQHLALHRSTPRRRWADWEDAALREGYTSALPYAVIASQLTHRTIPPEAESISRRRGVGSQQASMTPSAQGP